MNEEKVSRPGKHRPVQARKARKDGFSAAKKQVYLDTLAMCCTVSASASAAASRQLRQLPRRGGPEFPSHGS